VQRTAWLDKQQRDTRHYNSVHSWERISEIQSVEYAIDSHAAGHVGWVAPLHVHLLQLHSHVSWESFAHALVTPHEMSLYGQLTQVHMHADGHEGAMYHVYVVLVTSHCPLSPALVTSITNSLIFLSPALLIV